MSSRPFKIALVCSTLNQLGGPALHIRNFYRYLNGSEFQLTLIFCSQNETALRDFMREGGVRPEDMIFIPHARKQTVLPFILTLRDIFIRESFDIVHAFETQTQVLAGWAAYWAGVKKFICHCEAQFLPSTISFPKRFFFRTLNFFLKNYFTKTVAVSAGLKKELIKNGLRPPQKVQLIHLGIEVTQKQGVSLSYPGLAAGMPVIGTLSRLSIEKGLDRFIETMPRILKTIPAARFVIYGDGEEKESLRASAQRLGMSEKIEFKPWARDVGQAMQELEVFVMPSQREGLPIALLEAMSVGRLCVASDIEGIQDVIYNGIDGILIDTTNIQSFADAVLSVCSNPVKAVAMGQAAAEKVRSSFNIEREIREIRGLYMQEISH
ncbi:MAG: glycosyltransferase family 4 protein [Candidatus Omnitrophica bacterium]|nr:glycosyltransferase family 4 protein [Candidatus Omnitrophota bacterium]